MNEETPDMEEPNYSRIDDGQLMQTYVSDVSLWEKSTEKGLQERSDVIDGVVRNQRADYLGVVVEHGWDVNEMLQVYGSGRGRVKRTALHHAVYHRWYEGVRLLLTAGADCNIKCQWSGEADLSVQRHIARYYHQHFHPEATEALNHTPLCVAIYKDDVEMVKLLLKNGEDLPEGGCGSIAVNRDRLMVLYDLYRTGGKGISTKENAQILNKLLTNNTNLIELLLHYLAHKMFFLEHLDVLFTHGVDLDHPYQGGFLDYVFSEQVPVNTIRWLLRHGASCTPSLSEMLSYDNDTIQPNRLPPLMEVILQVGVKHSDSLKVHLGELQMRIQAYLQQGDSRDQDADIVKKTLSIYTDIFCAEHRLVKKQEEFRIDREQQMAHLREFSDHSLDVYPEEMNMEDSKRERWQQTLKTVSNMVHFLNEPRTLQWHCRVCLRESLVSLSPSVIRTLPGPAALKRYILCHEL